MALKHDVIVLHFITRNGVAVEHQCMNAYSSASSSSAAAAAAGVCIERSTIRHHTAP